MGSTIAQGAPPVIADVPSGCMGFAQGCIEAVPGARCAVAFDMDENAARTCEANHAGTTVMRGDFLHEPTRRALRDECRRRGVNVVVGGPPCQGFSDLNHSQDRERYERMNSMPMAFAEFAVDVGAEIIIMEEVRRFVLKGALDDVLAFLAEKGYAHAWGVLNAADYGVPQRRYRFILVATRGGGARGPSMPPRTHRRAGAGGDGDLVGHVTFREAMAAAAPRHGRPVTAAVATKVRDRERGSREHNAHYTNAYRIVAPGEPSLTITTMFRNAASGRFTVECGPSAAPESGLCLLSTEQAARLQGFPPGYRFVGPETRVATQIGNAVPPPLARAIFGHVVAEHRRG